MKSFNVTNQGKPRYIEYGQNGGVISFDKMPDGDVSISIDDGSGGSATMRVSDNLAHVLGEELIRNGNSHRDCAADCHCRD